MLADLPIRFCTKILCKDASLRTTFLFSVPAITVIAIVSSAPAAGQKPAHQIEPYQAKEVEVYKGKEIARPADSNAKDTNPDFFFRTFGLAVPGVAYTVDNYARDTRTLVTSTGALTKSSVRINRDHTYEWNSAWDGRIIRGKWVA